MVVVDDDALLVNPKKSGHVQSSFNYYYLNHYSRSIEEKKVKILPLSMGEDIHYLMEEVYY